MAGSGYSDLERPPLRESALRRALVVPGGLWTRVRVVAETGSTNADIADLARTGEPEGAVLVAERQDDGRGRCGRAWRSPARAGIAVSVLLRPGDLTGGTAAMARQRYGWIALLAGVALTEAVRRISGSEAVLKWPNDLLLGERKCAGILAEAVPGGPGAPAVVLGIGLNTTLRAEELPHPGATSLAIAGAACTDRDPLLRALLRGLADWYRRWRAVGGDPDGCGLREAYRGYCATLGRPVRVLLPGDRTLSGVAEAVDVDGRLVVCDGAGVRHALTGGDVVHVRTG